MSSSISPSATPRWNLFWKRSFPASGSLTSSSWNRIPNHKATIHQKLEPLRELVLTAPDLNAAVRRIIESEGDGQQAEGAAGE